MKLLVTTLLTPILLGIVVPLVRAQLPVEDRQLSPVLQAQTPIGELQRTPNTTISGSIRSVVGNEFILDDGTGQIIVDAGPRWYHQLDLRVGERVTVVGEYDDYDFDAYQITRSSGDVIRIREADGPPPWAGGPQRRNRF
ncbi:MAG: DNA-binding protein [Leptolyngbya sp. DLM2.Bin15]|nr:MAG: DNA-binding protein [Leptolyngbya sp. DLM2.Bin15]